MSSRSGEASGLVYPDTNSKSLCDATKKKPSVLLQRKTSLGCSVHYDNDGEKKSYNCIYNQIRMQKLDKRQKKNLVLYNQIVGKLYLFYIYIYAFICIYICCAASAGCVCGLYLQCLGLL
mgnify:CR=1 FL=1